MFLHILNTHQHHAQINITSGITQQPVIWKQHLQASGKDDNKMAEVLSVRIALNSLTNSSLWPNDNILTVTLASTNAIRMPSKNHHQTALGLVLYMAGSPEEIDELLTKPVPSTAGHKINKKNIYGIGAFNKRSSAPCQLQKGLKVKFSEVKGGYERILKPVTIEINKCAGECPLYLHHLHNPTQHSEVRNLLAFREGSASSDIVPASCVPVSFKKIPTIEYNKETHGIENKYLDELVATSCGCR